MGAVGFWCHGGCRLYQFCHSLSKQTYNSFLFFSFLLKGEQGPKGEKGDRGERGEPVSILLLYSFFSDKPFQMSRKLKCRSHDDLKINKL